MLPGARLGPYEISGLLGAGGMGEVYKARDLRLNRDVALKVLATTAKDRHTHLRVEQEAKAAAAVTHPHICTLYDIGHDSGTDFLVMEYLEGETLAQRISRGPMPVADVIRLGIEISEALAAAHRTHLVHRDLKPSNIMLTRNGVKLLDFGLAMIRLEAAPSQFGSAQTATALSDKWMLIGTLQYMAPEQLDGQAVDERADLFAFGAVLYEMLTGSRAFQGNSRAQLIAAILDGAPVPVRSVRPDVPLALAKIVNTCLAKPRADRWQNASDLAIALKAIPTHASRRPASRQPGPPAHSPTGQIRSLVVLPLANASPDQGEQYLADGLTESLIASLSVIGRLKVISRASSMRYRGSDKPLRQIASELRVEGIIRGATSVSGGHLSVKVELLNGADGATIWNGEYERPLTDLFRVEGEIAETIAAEIRLRLTSSERRRFRRDRPTDREANEAYLRGRYYWNRETPDALERSYHHLAIAVQKAPDCAAYQAALANWYLSAGNNGLVAEAEAIARGRTAALRALERDPALSEAHACLGRIAMREWDLQRARAEFDNACRLNPNLVEPVIWSARALSYLTLHDQALARVELAKQLDPVSPRPYVSAAAVRYSAGDCKGGIEESRRALEFEPDLPTAYYFMGVSQFQLGLISEAVDSLRAAGKKSNGHPASVAALAFVFASVDRKAEALQILDEMRERATRAEIAPYYFAEVYVALNDADKAMAYLNRSYELRIPDMIGIAVDPLFRGLHGNPQFDSLIKTLGLTAG
jgi:serine/threonine protein kinase/tetratricopeptide (TPR) repeat protein